MTSIAADVVVLMVPIMIIENILWNFEFFKDVNLSLVTTQLRTIC